MDVNDQLSVYEAYWREFSTQILQGRGVGEFSEQRSTVVCTTVIARLPFGVSATLHEIMTPLRSRYPGHHHYPPHTIHFTLTDISPIRRGDDHRDISAEGCRALDILGGELAGERPLKLRVQGLGVFPTSVFAQLIDVEGRLTGLRRQVAACLRREAGIEVRPPVAPGLVFANLMRFTDVPHDGVVAGVERYRARPRLDFDAARFEIVATDKVLSDRRTTALGGLTLAGAAAACRG
jgi:hypothetical protein